MLKRNGRNARMKLKALTDPQPEFVSLVFGGANKTPFRAMRADGATLEADDLTDEQRAKAETHAIARIEFSGENFADETAVRDWLVGGGYDNELPVIKTDTGFAVSGDVADDAAVTVIDLSDTTGVKVFATALKADGVLELTEKADEAGQTLADVHPGASEAMRQRYCGCVETCDSYCGSKDFAETVASNLDGVPPGLLDLHMALYDAMRNCMRDGDYVGATAAVGEYMKMLDALVKLLPAKTEKSMAFIDAFAPEIEMSQETEAEKAEKTEQVETVADAVETVKADDAAEKTEDTTETAEKSDEQDVTGATDTETAEKADETGEGEKTAEKSEENSDAVAEKADEVTDPLARLTAVVEELAASVKSMQGNLSGEIEQVVQRVAAIEDVRQTRKGADVDEAGNGSQASTTVSDQIADIRRRSVLGMRSR